MESTGSIWPCYRWPGELLPAHHSDWPLENPLFTAPSCTIFVRRSFPSSCFRLMPPIFCDTREIHQDMASLATVQHSAKGSLKLQRRDSFRHLKLTLQRFHAQAFRLRRQPFAFLCQYPVVDDDHYLVPHFVSYSSSGLNQLRKSTKLGLDLHMKNAPSQAVS